MSARAQIHGALNCIAVVVAVSGKFQGPLDSGHGEGGLGACHHFSPTGLGSERVVEDGEGPANVPLGVAGPKQLGFIFDA